MAIVFQRNVFQNNVFQPITVGGIISGSTAFSAAGTIATTAVVMLPVLRATSFEAWASMSSAPMPLMRSRRADFVQGTRVTSIGRHEPAHLKYRPGEVVNFRRLESDYGWRASDARLRGVLKNRKYG